MRTTETNRRDWTIEHGNASRVGALCCDVDEAIARAQKAERLVTNGRIEANDHLKHQFSDALARHEVDRDTLRAQLSAALAAQKAAEERAEKSWNTAVETCARYAEDYERDERGRSTFIGERIADTLRREVRLAPQAPADSCSCCAEHKRDVGGCHPLCECDCLAPQAPAAEPEGSGK